VSLVHPRAALLIMTGGAYRAASAGCAAAQDSNDRRG
jgi:hypothetical protein